MAVRVDKRLDHAFRLPALGPVKYGTFHCTATPEGKAFSAAQVVAMDVKLYKQPSYHILVLLDGTKVLCLKLEEKGAHVGKHNTGNIGVSYVGGIGPDGKPKDTRTDAQKRALREIAADLRATYKGITLKGHRDWSPDLDHDGVIEPHEWMKVCPCFDVATQL